jgi:Co/Zn/Cd efflux system component
MSDDCCESCHIDAVSERFRPLLWVALTINIVMFLVEMGIGVTSGSSALQADALDFLGDAANSAVSLAVVGLAREWRA